jgi:predicted alpha/beta hydrolase family esterase
VPPALLAGPGCIDLWIVSTRGAPLSFDPPVERGQFAVWHREPGGWIAYPYAAFIAAIDTEVPVCFYVNGLFTTAESTMKESQQLFANIGAGLPPFRGVHWLWPSDYELGVSLREQVNRALERMQAESFHLTATIRSLRNPPAVNLVGHSFGCQIVAETLARMGRCRMATQAVAGRCSSHPLHLQAALIAPTIDPRSLLTGGKFQAALLCVDRLLVTHNRDDVALHIYQQIHQHRALGLTGLPTVAGGQATKIVQIDAGPAVLFRHSASIYFQSPQVAGWLRGFISGG